MPPTVTVATMPILINTSAVRLAKKLLPRSEFRSLNALIKIKVVGLHPTPTKEDCSSYPPWMLQDAPKGVESPLCSLTNLLSLPKDASLHLRKLARHPWRDSRNLSIRPAATPRGGVFLEVLSR